MGVNSIEITLFFYFNLNKRREGGGASDEKKGIRVFIEVYSKCF